MCSLTGGQKGKSVKSCSNWFYKFKSLTALGSVHPSGRCRPLLVGEQGLNPGRGWGGGQASAAGSLPCTSPRGATRLRTPWIWDSGRKEEEKQSAPQISHPDPWHNLRLSGQNLPPRRFGSQRPYIYRAAALLNRHVLYIYICLDLFSRPTGKE